MHFPLPDRLFRHAGGILLLLSLIQGCTLKPWTHPLNEAESLAVRSLPEIVRAYQAQCAPCIDTDATLQLDSPIGERSLSGYLLLMQPEEIKYIVHNPLGQPVLAFSGNSNVYSYLNTLDRVILTGDPGQLIARLDFPKIFGSGSWNRWLLGHLPITHTISGMRYDRDKRGIWFDYDLDGKGETRQDHMLIDPDTYRVLSRVITVNGKVAVQLDYQGNMPGKQEKCPLPDRVMITGFNLSTSVEVRLEQTRQFATCTRQDFQLPSPPGYTVHTIELENH